MIYLIILVALAALAVGLPRRYVEIPIVCENEYCVMNGKDFNRILLRKKAVDAFMEAYKHGSEDEIDYCPNCGDLGVAQDSERPR